MTTHPLAQRRVDAAKYGAERQQALLLDPVDLGGRHLPLGLAAKI